MSAWLYWIYNIEDPYYNENIGKFYKIVSTYYLWTNSMLMISLVLYNTEFNGGLIAWILGLPFIGLIMLSEKKSHIETLVRSDVKFRSGE